VAAGDQVQYNHGGWLTYKARVCAEGTLALFNAKMQRNAKAQSRQDLKKIIFAAFANFCPFALNGEKVAPQ
jgi:hypothetical protein